VISCRWAAQLMTQSLDGRLPVRQRVGLAVHAVLCGACRCFRHQIAAIDEAAAAVIGEVLMPFTEAELPPQTKEHLRLLIRARLDQRP
jgi:hypothetical protein